MADSAKVSFPKLGSSNWGSWKQRMEWLLEKEDLWDVIRLEKPEDADADWLTRDRKARANIGLCLEESQFKIVQVSESARGMWAALKEHHERATMSTVVFYLTQLCGANMDESDDMDKHLSEMEELFDKLAAAGQNLEESLKIAMIFKSVPQSYRVLVQTLQCRADADWTVVSVKTRLLDEFRQRQQQGASLSENMRAMKLAADSSKEERRCFFCKQPGHVKAQCKKWLAKNNSGGFGKKRGARDEKPKDDNPRAKQAQDVNSAVCFMAGDSMPTSWVIDSGATAHMTSDRAFFHSLRTSVDTKVTLADGNKTKVDGLGDGVIFGEDGRGGRVEITLKNVLFVPELDGGLISVSQLAAKGFVVVFGASDCTIRNAAGETVVVGDKVGSLYRLRVQQRSLKAAGEHNDRCQHTWHRRVGHRDPDVLRRMDGDNLVSGFKLSDCGVRTTCECCLKGKLARKPFPPVVERKANRPLGLIHTDLCGPMETATPSGNRYIMTLIDDFSRFTTVYLLKTKDEAAGKIKEFVRRCENLFGRKPVTIRSDGGGEYTGRELRKFYEYEGIKAEYTTPYTPQQNGVAERKNRSLQEMAICMLADANMGKQYWGEAVMAASYIQNRVPSRVIGKTPYELWMDRKPDVAHLKVFGCSAYVRVPDARRSKLDHKAVKLTFVGYSEDHKGYRFLDPSTNRITISRDAKFIELDDGSEMQKKPAPQATAGDPESNIEVPLNVLEDQDDTVAARPRRPPFEVQDNGEDSGSEIEGFVSADDSSEEGGPGSDDGAFVQEEQELRRQDRRTRGVLPRRLKDFVVSVAKSAAEEPTDHREAAEVKEWKDAMDSEMRSHEENTTWELVPLPNGKKVIGSRWVFSLKRDENGNVIKYKARLVAQGFTQRFGVDYLDVFAPVTRHETLLALLAVAGKNNMSLQHFDVRTAYLHGKVEEEIFMRQPPGYAVAGKEELVCRLIKSIYGLKQAARCWHRALHAVLVKLGFRQCQADSCLYVRRDGRITIFLLVYVDDLLVGCVDPAKIGEVYEALKKELDIVNLGAVKHFLGYDIQFEEGVYSLRLKSYIEALVKRFNLEDCKPSKTPMDAGYTRAGNDSKPFTDITLYRSLVGALLYVAVNARPDVAVSVSLLGRKASAPTDQDWKAAKRIVRYLKGTKDMRLKFGPGDGGWNLVGYSDADWAGDLASRRSTTGYVFFFGGGPIAWVSRRQSCVSLSSMEAEYISLSDACQELTWLRRLMADLGEQQRGATIMYEDNQSCLSFVQAERATKRSKHIDTRRHFIKDLSDRGEVKLLYCPSEQMTADALTKPLGATRFWQLLRQLGVSN